MPLNGLACPHDDLPGILIRLLSVQKLLATPAISISNLGMEKDQFHPLTQFF